MKHKFLRLFDADGNWTRPTRTIKVDGVEYDMDEYAKQHGIVLPDSKAQKKPKKEINTDKQDHSYGDMEEQDHRADQDVDGEGDSQSTE